MTLDAMHWVWNHSQSKGNPRIALLAVADQVRTSACEVRISYPDFMRALNVTNRTTVRDAIKAAVELGELEILAPGKGTRKALYRLPKAVGYTRSDPTRSTESVLLEPEEPRRSGTESVLQGPASSTESVLLDTDHDHASSTDSAPEQYGIRPSSSTDSAPLYQPSSPKRERAIEGQPADAPTDGIPDFARPLVDGCTLADISIRWPFSNGEWFKVHAAIKKSGVPALVDYARRVYSRQRGDVDSARYFLRGWCELAPMPLPGTERPPLRALPAVAGGFPPAVSRQQQEVDDWAARAMARAEARMQQETS